MARILGIDLGSHTVKVAVFDGSFGRFELVDYHLRPVAQDLDEPPSLDTRIEALRDLLGELGSLKGTTSAAGFPSEEASVRLISLPFADRAKVQQALPFEVENQVPFDLDEMLLAPRIVKLAPGDSQVLAGMAPTVAVGKLLGALSDVGIDPKVLPIDADVHSRLADEGVQAIMDIGHSRTLVTLCQDGKVLGCRAISRGGRALTAALCTRAGLDWDAAEGQKHALSIHPLAPRPESVPPLQELPTAPPRVVDEDTGGPIQMESATEPPSAADLPPPRVPAPGAPTPIEPHWDDDEPEWDEAREWEDDDPTQNRRAAERAANLNSAPTLILKRKPTGDAASMGWILRDAATPLLGDLRATLISFEDSLEVSIDEVILAGGTASTGGLPELLQEILGVPVRLARVSELAQDRGYAGRFALAHGLGRTMTGRNREELLDLRKGPHGFRGDLATIGNIARYGAVAAFFFVMVGMALFGWRTYQLNGNLAQVDQDIKDTVLNTFPEVSPDRLKDSSTALAIMQEKTLETTARVEALGSLITDEPPVLDDLLRLTKAMPAPGEARVDVRELSINTTTIQFKAQTDGYEEVSKIERSLQNVARYKGATKGDEKKTKQGDVSFTVTIPLGGSTAEEG